MTTSPCPFCSCRNISMRVHLARQIGEHDRVHMECKACMASGPAHFIEAVSFRAEHQLNDAIRVATKLWNERHG